ncbi:glycosyltransferase [Kitasatospora sp. NPDC087315]|uniref:glycosyltransferase n=1 Tax=Kitasatospora sp. NPDC087315 TaxID=3364069 RepID=UPI003814D710
MHILIATAGSRGNVAPFTGLGARLHAAGHQVAVATHTAFADSVRAAGLEFRPLPIDPRAVLASAGGRRLLQAGAGPRALIQLLHPSRSFMPALGEESPRPPPRAPISCSPPAPRPPSARSPPRPPAFPASPSASSPSPPPGSSHHPSPVPAHSAAPGTCSPATPSRPPPTASSLPPSAICAAGSACPATAPRAPSTPSPSCTASHPPSFPGPPTGTPASTSPATGGPTPTPRGNPRPAWPTSSPPVFVGFGSLVVPDPDRLTATVLAALRAARVRAVVQSGWSGLTAPDSDDVLTIDDTPHHWLLPRTAAVIHHAGAGTTAAALRAGTPTIPVPAQLDAPFWSARLTRLGVTPGPVPLKTLTPARLAAAIRRTLDTPQYHQHAQVIATTLAKEDGTTKVLATIDRLAD